MPYILQKDRVDLFTGVRKPANSGELNFMITSLLIDYIQEHGLRYANINGCLGALSGADYEFKRRVVKPYEKKKCAENGDVYPPLVAGRERV